MAEADATAAVRAAPLSPLFPVIFLPLSAERQGGLRDSDLPAVAGVGGSEGQTVVVRATTANSAVAPTHGQRTELPPMEALAKLITAA